MDALYKILRSGESWHGGAHRWSLPVQGDDGTWTPGDWTPAVSPVLCSTGWHLTREPARWWGDGDVRAFLVEVDGAVTRYDDGDAKCAVERCRLMRPLTEAELAAHGVFLSGRHEVSSGIAHARDSATVRAWGSATVEASGSATVEASGSATVEASGSATVRAWGSATVEASGSATVEASGSATVEASGSATVRARDSATVEASDSATVRAWDSATVTAWGSARAHIAGQSVCTAWRGASLVLTRAEQGVIIDRRGDVPKIYAKRRGVDGWRYDETAKTWSQKRKATP